MASGEPEIKDGLKLPVWMKTKPAKDFDPFPGSPPGPEDSFFYMKYPKTDVLFGKANIDQDLSKVLNEQSREPTVVGASALKDKDWSKHTKPCQDVMHGMAPINTIAGAVPVKPAGTDDGFKGEGAACGTSIVKVATQMISSRNTRGFTVATPEDEPEPPSQRYLMSRRGSKSLPTTPNSSPKSRRKVINGNRYFTSPFEQTEDGNSRSWLTMALLGFKKDLTTSTSTLTEEDAIENRLHGGSTFAESVENLGPSPKAKPELLTQETPIQQPKTSKLQHGFRPKPTELRELNFWSPTSM